MKGLGSATTHNSMGRGPGGGRQHKVSRRNMTPPSVGLRRGVPLRGNNAPWYLKGFGSRPASKQRALTMGREEAA